MTEQAILRDKISKILHSHEKVRSRLISILQEVQEKLGYLPDEGIQKIAEYLEISEATVFGAATFYNQFRFNPPGRHPIKICMGTACHMKGGGIILESFERNLLIKVGETTPDREFSLERVACVGCCALAPVAVVEDIIEGKISPTRVDGILLAFKREREEEKRKDSN